MAPKTLLACGLFAQAFAFKHAAMPVEALLARRQIDLFPSPDGDCGQINETTGATCRGSSFGSCCSQYYVCGSDADSCGDGCMTDYGLCDDLDTSTMASFSTTLPFANSTSTVLSVTAPVETLTSTGESGSIILTTLSTVIANNSVPPSVGAAAPPTDSVSAILTFTAASGTLVATTAFSIIKPPGNISTSSDSTTPPSFPNTLDSTITDSSSPTTTDVTPVSTSSAISTDASTPGFTGGNRSGAPLPSNASSTVMPGTGGLPASATATSSPLFANSSMTTRSSGLSVTSSSVGNAPSDQSAGSPGQGSRTGFFGNSTVSATSMGSDGTGTSASVGSTASEMSSPGGVIGTITLGSMTTTATALGPSDGLRSGSSICYLTTDVVPVSVA